MRNTPSENQMPKNYLPMFLEDKYNEAFGPWNDDEPWRLFISEDKNMNREKGLAYCGLACLICGENEMCAGCRNAGCKNKERCKHFNGCNHSFAVTYVRI